MSEMITVRAVCTVCDKIEYVVLDKQKYDRWVAGELIQNVWPEKTAAQREQLVSGTCSDQCWDKLFSEDE
jgi:hypothetical protein